METVFDTQAAPSNHEFPHIVPSSGSAETLENVRKRSKTFKNARKRLKTKRLKTSGNDRKLSKRQTFFPAATEPQTSAAAAAAAAAAVAAAAVSALYLSALYLWPVDLFRNDVRRQRWRPDC